MISVGCRSGVHWIRDDSTPSIDWAFAEQELPEAKRALRELLGDGARRPLWKETSRTELAPWLALAAVLPLGFVLWRRNLP